MALLKRKRTGLGDAMEVVTRFVNACNRHDADGVYSCLHPDFDSIQPMYPSRNFRGADQVRRNWQAIFDAEPGFRLTVLRSAAVDDTIWLELHGAGEDAEVAGVFVMGIQGDRIRWARIYSALVEPVPEGVGQPPAPLREVSRPDQPAATGDGEVVEEALIAPVLDMDRSGRRRRRRRGGEDEGDGDSTEAGVAAAGGGDVPDVISGNADMQTTVVVEGEDQIATVGNDDQVPAIDGDEVAVVVDDVAVLAEGDTDVAVIDAGDEVAVVVEGDSDAAVEPGDEGVVVVAGPEADVAVVTGADTEVVVVTDEPEPEGTVDSPADDDAGPSTEALDMVKIVTDPPADPAPPTPEDPPRRGLFGRKRP